jgi:hypothetical protein
VFCSRSVPKTGKSCSRFRVCRSCAARYSGRMVGLTRWQAHDLEDRTCPTGRGAWPDNRAVAEPACRATRSAKFDGRPPEDKP